MVTLVIGGARSGKTAFALKLAAEYNGQKAYIATAQALDEEMKVRISRHREERGADWDTIEEPLGLSELIEGLSDRYGALVLDCLTLWLTNLLLAEGGQDIDRAIDKFISALDRFRDRGCPASLIMVTNEVGMGIVPENQLARRFRDLAGRLNQKTAATADRVYMVVAGLPIKIK